MVRYNRSKKKKSDGVLKFDQILRIHSGKKKRNKRKKIQTGFIE